MLWDVCDENANVIMRASSNRISFNRAVRAAAEGRVDGMEGLEEYGVNLEGGVRRLMFLVDASLISVRYIDLLYRF